MFTKTSLKTKLIASFLIVAAFLCGVGFNGLFSLNKVDGTYSHVSKVDMPNIINLGTVEADTKDLVIRSFRLLLLENRDPAQAASIIKLMDEAHKDVDDAIAQYEALPFAEGEGEIWKDTKAAMEEVHQVAEKMAELAKSGKPEDVETMRKLMAELPKKNMAFTEAMNKSSEFIEGLAKKSVTDAQESAVQARFTMVGGILVGLIASLALAFLLARYISNALNKVAASLSGGSQEVASASTQISSASTELSASATEQAAALQQTVASLEQVSAMVNKNADNAKRSLETSSQSQSAANKGKEAVNTMITSIQEISASNTEIMQQIDQSNKEISEIVKVIAEIGNKTKVINDIVFQTKLLSFNASVEAARAGEHGKGFAVVAEEVGNLAQMSGNAAKEISTMLDGSIQKVEGIVQNTKTRVERLVTVGKEKVDTGSQTAQVCGEILNEIVSKVSEVNQIIGEISTASQEQAQGVQEINKAMTQLDQVTQQNAAAAQQASSAGESLMSQTTELEVMVASLRDLVNGQGGSASHAAPAPRARAEHKPSPAKTEKKAESKVIAMPTRSRAPKKAEKMAVGQTSTPSEHDPRFEDV
jgi:methyl-accepting chemotaxis protein